MIITICNYNIYQNPKNYESHNEDHNEDHNENTTKTQLTPQDTERKRKEWKKKGNKTFSENSIEFSLSKLLFSLMLKNNPKAKKPNFQEWAVHIDRAIRFDKRTPEEIERVIKWTQQDDFEMSNILSTQKLRKRFDQLFLRMNSTKSKKLKGGPVIESSLKPPKILTAEEIEEMNRAN